MELGGAADNKFGRSAITSSSFTALDAVRRGVVWREEARSRTPGPHGALGPVRATPRMPPPPGLPPTPEELASLRSKYGDAKAQNCRILSRRNRARQHIQRPRLAFLLRESLPLPLPLPPKHQILAPKPKRRSLIPTTTPPRSTLRSRASRASTSASPRCSLSACRATRCRGLRSSARARRSETRTPRRRSRGCAPSSTWARR